jgi:hypothetical protein
MDFVYDILSILLEAYKINSRSARVARQRHSQKNSQPDLGSISHFGVNRVEGRVATLGSAVDGYFFTAPNSLCAVFSPTVHDDRHMAHALLRGRTRYAAAHVD